MKRKPKPEQIPQVPATRLESLDAIEELQFLPDEALDIELVNAATTESFQRTNAAAFRAQGTPDGDKLADMEISAAAYSRIAREVIAMIQFFRSEYRKGGENGKDGKPGPKGPKGYL